MRIAFGSTDTRLWLWSRSRRRGDPAAAQDNQRRHRGTITDTQGGVLPGVSLTVTNSDNGDARTSVTEARR